METLGDEYVELVAEAASLRFDLERARRYNRALEQALNKQRGALDDAHALIAKYRLEIVGLLDKAREG